MGKKLQIVDQEIYLFTLFCHKIREDTSVKLNPALLTDLMTAAVILQKGRDNIEMENLWIYVTLPGAVIWFVVLVLPWRPWSMRERFEAGETPQGDTDLSAVTVLIPARNEAAHITSVLTSVFDQGRGIQAVVVDDQSTDGTAQVLQAAGYERLKVVSGAALPAGWSGKLWALEQARQSVNTPFTLLLDADIELAPGTVSGLLGKMDEEGLGFVSLMAWLRMAGFWEKLLMPAFIYFFKLLYPFQRSNTPSSSVAAGAGGCILLKTDLLERIGGFSAIRDALIDDCALARSIKQTGCRTWIGVTRSVKSLRSCDNLQSVWKMVSRTAYTQLKYSPLLLLVCVVLMMFSFVFPVAGLFSAGALPKIFSATGLCLMYLCYLPTLLYYRIPLCYGLLMPVTGTLFLAMTLSSAMDYYRGKRSRWKGRVYR